MSTLAPAMMPTSECQLGNGSRKNSPNDEREDQPDPRDAVAC